MSKVIKEREDKSNVKGNKRNGSGNRGKRGTVRRNSKERAQYKGEARSEHRGNRIDVNDFQDKLSSDKPNNDPSWYYLDAAMADQESRLSFQQLAGLSVVDNLDNEVIPVPTIAVNFLAPAPGVQLDSTYTSAAELQKSAVNLAGFRLFSKLSAYTGRVATYGPQDVSIMILFMGEVISMVEEIRRAFGLSWTYSVRNRAVPKSLLRAMGYDADDLFVNYSTYRTQFNSIITRLNQIPIPKGIKYFDKCASLYQAVYSDEDSPMAQLIVDVPATTWYLDEQSNPGGTQLTTQNVHLNKAAYAIDPYLGPQAMSVYLKILSDQVDQLMNSSSLQVVYTDLLNLARKTNDNAAFWTFDYLLDGYQVVPVFNPWYLLQWHNQKCLGVPGYITSFNTTFNITPYNDVVPNPNNNAVYYNPAFNTFGNSATEAVVEKAIIVDALDPNYTAEQRIEMTRRCALTDGTIKKVGTLNVSINMVLADHYAQYMRIFTSDPNVYSALQSCYTYEDSRFNADISAFNYAPLTHYVRDNGGGSYTKLPISHGQLNYWTLIDVGYLRRLTDFIGLALYDVRAVS